MVFFSFSKILHSAVNCTWKRKRVTLVLDMDETLIHSTTEPCDNADFTIQVDFNTVYVRKRPFVMSFLKRVAKMFEVVVFTASERTYAEQVLDRLDPDGKLFSRRAYRDECKVVNGVCAKDLRVLGIDLAKVAIIDNSPEVYRLQLNNGIPIKSWYDDPSDQALTSLLPFLETLVDVEDVRPIIARRFRHELLASIKPAVVITICKSRHPLSVTELQKFGL